MAKIPVEYINPFFAAVKSVCGDIAKLPVTPGTLRVRSSDERLWKLYPISVVIQLSDAVTGFIGLSFSEAVAKALAEGLADETFAVFNDDARDSLGEVVNLIVGSAKRNLPGGLISISTPKLIATHHLEIPAGMPTLILPFETTQGRFVMNLAMLKNNSI